VQEDSRQESANREKNMSKECIICQIIAGTASARIVYRDDDAIAFLPLELNAKGHIVVAPVSHCADLFNIPESDLSRLMRTVQFLAGHCKQTLGAHGVNMLHASGAAAQQSVPHFHIHLLPRFEGDGLDAWPPLSEWDGDLDELLTTIKVHDAAT
jgi:histidine triad (HIT) family protein